MFGVLVQASTVCHVVTCSLPSDPPKCHHETPETPNPETCKEFAAAAASVSLEITVAASPVVVPALNTGMVAAHEPAFLAHSPPATSTVLRV
jgi:hypothetical protein